jgi:hypothetical protein
MPTTILIDRTGRARWRVVGELAPDDPRFRRALDKMLETTSAAHTREKNRT